MSKYKNLWIFIGLFLFLIFFVLIGGLMSLGFSVNNKTQNYEQQQKKDIKTLKIENVKVDGKYITGTIKNTLDYDLKYICIEALFYNKNKEIINNSIDNLSSLYKDNKWRFNILILDEYDSYQLSITDIDKANDM
jgi:hypothetical protein